MGEVEKLLREYADAKTSVTYFLLSGNAGDALLNVGFFVLARRIGLNYSVINRVEDVPREGLVVFSGGGGLVETWGGTVLGYILQTARVADKVVVLPSSIHGNEELLRQLPSNVHLFTRDRTSYGLALGIRPMLAQIYIDHDMAFHIDVEELLSVGIPDGFRPVTNGKRLLRYLAYIVLKARGKRAATISTFRSDKEGEKRESKLVRRVGDLSEVCNFGLEDETRCFGTAILLARLVDVSDSIVTDRLHVGICGYLAGKNVTLVDSGYGKLRSVASFSMPGVAVLGGRP